jgi:formylglycine-generating enzyme required for sulfatase activity
MKILASHAALAVAILLPSTALHAGACPRDSVKVGTTCIDKFEASIWRIPADNGALLRKVRSGNVKLADLATGGASQLGAAKLDGCGDDYGAGFPSSGNWTDPVYAVSVPGVLPSTCVTWFQAEQACALSEKRLPTNQEWQRAAAGTPDPQFDDGTTTCNQGFTFGPVLTGSRPGCVSSWGVYDMVGNVAEMVGDWDEQATSCGSWLFGDTYCSGGPGDAAGPGSPARGGYWDFGFPNGGVFHYNASISPAAAYSNHGFRCAR